MKKLTVDYGTYNVYDYTFFMDDEEFALWDAAGRPNEWLSEYLEGGEITIDSMDIEDVE